MSDEETLVQRIGARRQKKRGRAFLTVLSGRDVGQVYKLGPGESVIGRGNEADVQVVDEGVSRRHAKVVRDLDGTSKIMDMQSTNGTYVNGRRVEVEPLREGDRIRIGQSATLDFRYEYVDTLEGAKSEDEPKWSPPSGAREPAKIEPLVGGTSDQYAQAIRAYLRTLKVREETFGPNHPAVAAILDTIGAVLRSRGEYEEALRYQTRALAIYEARVGDADPPPEMAHLLANIGECQLGMGFGGEALETLERALVMLESRRAEDSELASVRFAIARALIALQREPVRARSLATLAREGYAEATGGKIKVAEVERWLVDHDD